jgi:dTDP-4-dehydrorhamnose reductase
MKHRVAIFGSTGQLGTDLVDVLPTSERFVVVPLTHEDADCTDAGAVRNVLHAARPQIVINGAAYVRVDDCEDHAREAFEVNAVGALNIARTCAELDALCVYISTDYVFDGTKGAPYVESDPTCPINVYGASKLAGEFLVRQTARRWLIVRAASLFGRTGARGKGGNFVETILARAKRGGPLAVVNDVLMTPTYTRDAATGLVDLLRTGADGVVHLTNDGVCSWYEFAKQAVELCGLRASIAAVSSAEHPSRARRPRNSALISERALVKLQSWQDALKAYLLEKGHIGASLATTTSPNDPDVR